MQQVDQQSQKQEKRRQQEQFALHRGQIPIADVGDQHRAEARKREQVLHYHHPGDHLREGQANHRHQLRNRQTQSHTQHGLPACHAARHGHGDRLGGSHVPHRGTRVTHNRSTGGNACGQRRQNQRGHRAQRSGPSRVRESLRRQQSHQSNAFREQQNQQQAAPQRRDRTGYDRGRMEHPAQPHIAGQHRRASEWQSDRQRNQQAQHDQREGDGSARGHLCGHRLAADHGSAEITVQQAEHPIAILRRIRLIQPHLRAQRRQPFRRRIGAGHHGRHIARQDSQQRKHQQR